MENRNVLIAHVPYEFRGGEDVHVEMLEKLYQDMGYKVYYLPENREPPKNHLNYAANSLKPFVGGDPDWIQIYQKIKPKFIHLNNAFPQLGPRFFRWVMQEKIPMIMTVHNHRFYCTNGLALRDGKVCKECFTQTIPIKALLYNCNDSIAKTAYHTAAMSEMHFGNLYQNAVQHFIAPSPYILHELLLWGIPKEKVSWILNPFQLDDAIKQNEIQIDVFYAGRLSQEKGIQRLIDIAMSRKDLKFGIAGSGPLESEVIKMAKESSNVYFFSSLSKSQVQSQIKNSKVGILPSICNEILPTFALECLALGIPCVVSNMQSMQWMMNDPWSVYLADPNLISEFSNQIDLAIQNKKKHESNKDLIRAELSKELFTKKLNQIISRFL